MICYRCDLQHTFRSRPRRHHRTVDPRYTPAASRGSRMCTREADRVGTCEGSKWCVRPPRPAPPLPWPLPRPPHYSHAGSRTPPRPPLKHLLCGRVGVVVYGRTSAVDLGALVSCRAFPRSPSSLHGLQKAAERSRLLLQPTPGNRHFYHSPRTRRGPPHAPGHSHTNPTSSVVFCNNSRPSHS
ncbi:hypothetical protein O3P69_018523 [Scylla paramamosain]|uniref:Uncharacterized protein n=1 Tax=Scylla paramamosain TaxID=85552 RepID=A0AAW0T260_SCYPA